jgi:hypothetical protein
VDRREFLAAIPGLASLLLIKDLPKTDARVLEVERALLGGLLTHPDQIRFYWRLPALAFTDSKNAILWTIALNLDRIQVPGGFPQVSLTLGYDRMMRNRVGGIPYLAHLRKVAAPRKAIPDLVRQAKQAASRAYPELAELIFFDNFMMDGGRTSSGHPPC